MYIFFCIYKIKAYTNTPMKKVMPQYTHTQEIWNSLTHLAGVVFSFIVLSIFIVLQVRFDLSIKYMYPFYIYFGFMLVVFLNSTLYHSSPMNSKIRLVCRMIDHCDIYLFVAGTYTPICLREIADVPIAVSLTSIQYFLAIVGVLVTIFGLGKKKWDVVGYIIYIIQGWAVIFFYPFKQVLDFNVFIFILSGGVLYTIGAVAYAIGKHKSKWFHTIFHLNIVVAAIVQFIGIYNIFCPFF